MFSHSFWTCFSKGPSSRPRPPRPNHCWETFWVNRLEGCKHHATSRKAKNRLLQNPKSAAISKWNHIICNNIYIYMYSIRRPRQTQGGVRKGKRVYDTAARKE